MKPEQNSTNEISWTWADQISSYKFWGLCFFFLFLTLSNVVVNTTFSLCNKELGITIEKVGILHLIKTLASLVGFWLAWFLVRMKNHKLLYLFSSLTILGLLLIYSIPSLLTLSVCSFLVGLSFGAIVLSIPTLISNGRGGSEMFVISFGIITFFEVTFPFLSYMLPALLLSYKAYILISIAFAVIGSLLLIPIKGDIFNTNPPIREFAFSPIFRNPTQVALLSIIPIFNIYYFVYLTYRYHGEVNSINPSQNILSPGAAAWFIILIPLLYPVIMSSLNDSMLPKLLNNSGQKFYKTWVIILWAFIFLPVSFALIQSNMNALIKSEVS
jgi:hypothetical protein